MKLSVLLLHLLVSSLVRISYQCSLSSIAKGRCPPDGSDPTVSPSRRPTTEPTLSPSRYPSKAPTRRPSVDPTENPSRYPSAARTRRPTANPSAEPTGPSFYPSYSPSNPTTIPSSQPLKVPTLGPSKLPTLGPTTRCPTTLPSYTPSSLRPSKNPSFAPTVDATDPTNDPTLVPSATTTSFPSAGPTIVPSTTQPSTARPSTAPTSMPSSVPSTHPSATPTSSPTIDSTRPTKVPTAAPTAPTPAPTDVPSLLPSTDPTWSSSAVPTAILTDVPSPAYSPVPSIAWTVDPSNVPTKDPTVHPSEVPTVGRTSSPLTTPSKSPSVEPSPLPTITPSLAIQTFLSLRVSQNLTGIGTKTFLASSNYTQAFRSAVSDSLTGIRPDQVTDIAVRTIDQPSSARYLRDLSTPGASTVEISYAIGFIMEELGYTDPDAAFSMIKTQLQSSVEDSTFNQLLQKFGFPADVAASVPKFGSEMVVTIRSAEPSPSPTSRIGRSSPAIFPGVAFKYSILIIVVGAVVIALIIALSRYYCLKACVSKDGVKDKERRYDSLADEDGKEEEEEEMGTQSVLGASGDRVATEHPAEPSTEIHRGVGEEKRNNLSQRSAFSSFLKALSEGYDHLPPSSTADTPQPGPEEVDALSSDQVEVLVASESKDREVEGQGDDASDDDEQQSLLEMVSELLLPSPPSPTPSTDEQHPGRSEAEPSDEPIHTPVPSSSLLDEKTRSPGKSKTGLGGLLKMVGRKLTGSKPTVIEKDPPHIVVDRGEESIPHGIDEKDMSSGDGEQKEGQASVPAPVAEQQSLLDMVSEMIASTIPDLPFNQTGEQPPQEVATDSAVAEQSTHQSHEVVLEQPAAATAATSATTVQYEQPSLDGGSPAAETSPGKSKDGLRGMIASIGRRLSGTGKASDAGSSALDCEDGATEDSVASVQQVRDRGEEGHGEQHEEVQSSSPSTDEQHPSRSEAVPSDHAPSPSQTGSPGKSKTGLGGMLKLIGRKLTGSKPAVIEKDPNNDASASIQPVEEVISIEANQKERQASVPAPVAEQQSLLDMVSEMIASTISDLPFDQTGEQPPQEVATDSVVAEQSTKVAAGSVEKETVNDDDDDDDDDDDNEDTELSSLPSQQASLLDLASELIAAMLPDGEEEAQDSPTGKQGDGAQSDQVGSPVASKALSQKSLPTGTAEKRGGHALTTSFSKPRSILKKPKTDENSTEFNGARSSSTTQQSGEASTGTHSPSSRTPIKLASKTGKVPLNRPTFSAPKKSPLSMHAVLKAVSTTRAADAGGEMRPTDDPEQSQTDDMMDFSADSTVLSSSSSSARQLRTPQTANSRQVSFTTTPSKGSASNGGR